MFGLWDSPLEDNLWILLFISWAVINVFWCVQMQKALVSVFPNNKMKPQYVWLTFIPFFGLGWQFWVTKNVGEALGEEYERRGIIAREARPGNNVGLTANILLCCAILPTVGILIALFGQIPRIIQIVKVKNATDELEKIIQTQMQYPVMPPPIYEPPIDQQAEEIKKNNPDRFKPPQKPETDYERWRKK
jgi:hypothetical protein